MAFHIPSFDQVDEHGRNIPDEGWHDCTLTGRAAKQSRGGNDMMVVDFTIDNGPGCGHTVTEYIVFGLKGLMGEAKLKRICAAASFRWEQRNSLAAFVEQFPVNKLRLAVEIAHSYSIKRGDGWEDVEKPVWDAFDGDKNVRAQCTGSFRAASAPRELTLASDMYGAASGGDGAAEPIADDEPLPF